MTNLSQGYSMTPAAQRKGFRIHLIVFLLANPALWLVWYLTGPNYPWPLWQTSAWAVGLIFHYLGVYVFGKSKSNQKNY